MVKSQLKVVVLMGGIGPEREVSIQSGRSVANALAQAGAEVAGSDISPDDTAILDDASADVFFIALHGEFGEDGQLQKILQDRGLAYTGSGPEASALAMDKLASKQRFAEAGVPIPAAVKFDGQTNIAKLGNKLGQFPGRYVVKPVRGGSSVGITILEDPASAIQAAKHCLVRFGDCMIEQYVKGALVTVGILRGEALPIIEVRSKNQFYDYHAKYIDDSTEYLFDTIADASVIKRIEGAAVACFNCLGCRDFARVDFILGQDEIPYVLEVNTIPGFTSHSLLPKAAAKARISMSDLCMKISEAALENAQMEKR